MTEIGAGIRGILARKSISSRESEEKTLFMREIISVKDARDTWVKYRNRFKYPPERTPVADLYRLVNEVGYKVEEVKLGFKYVDSHGRVQEVTPVNSSRIGEGNRLYVAVGNSGEPIDPRELCHDVGVCLMGGKVTQSDQVPRIRVDTFNQITQFSRGITYTREELDQRRLFEPGGDKTSIPRNYIFDSLLEGRLSQRDIEVLPQGK